MWIEHLASFLTEEPEDQVLRQPRVSESEEGILKRREPETGSLKFYISTGPKSQADVTCMRWISHNHAKGKELNWDLSCHPRHRVCIFSANELPPICLKGKKKKHSSEECRKIQFPQYNINNVQNQSKIIWDTDTCDTLKKQKKRIIINTNPK